jgi:UDP-N-acetylmuramoyl-tripeptide--D-alanyl-D-alanine ligase
MTEEFAAPLWSSHAIAKAVGGQANGEFRASGVAFDSREVGPGDLFVAMRGEQADGHDYIAKAFANGAAGVICEREVTGGPCIIVEDSAAALEALGIASRTRSEAVIIGVTGSAGKTGTKEALHQALDRIPSRSAHRSVKSYNNHVGVPLSLSRMPETSEFAVLEMGMNHAGELSALTKMVRPNIAIVTTVASAHIEFFDSEADIARAKAEIFEGLEPGGTAIIPYDNVHYPILYKKAEDYADKIITFGASSEADCHIVDQLPAMDGGTLVTAMLNGELLVYRIAQPGEHWVMNSLAVLAAVQAAGGDLAVAGLALAEMGGLAGRGARNMVAIADGEALVIDESYNANPASMRVTLGDLGLTKADRKVAILGSMKELGDKSDDYHAALDSVIIASGVSQCLLVGDEMKILADRLSNSLEYKGQVAHVTSSSQALDWCRSVLCPGDAILVKGSNSLGLGSVVKALANDVLAGEDA